MTQENKTTELTQTQIETKVFNLVKSIDDLTKLKNAANKDYREQLKDLRDELKVTMAQEGAK